MSHAVALIPIDLTRSALGLPSQVTRPLAGRTVLAHTLARVARIDGLAGIVMIHPHAQAEALATAMDGIALPLPVHRFAVAADTLGDAFTAMRVSARKVAPASWRGGLGGVTCYDELLCAQPMLDALDAHAAGSAVLVGPDWPVLDPAITAQVLAIHLEDPSVMQMTFCQAAPGLAGIAIGRDLLAQLAGKPVCLGNLLAYNPQHPQADPIGKDVCVQIPPAARDCAHRLIADLPRSLALLDRLVGHLGEADFAQADAATLTQAITELHAQPTHPADAAPPRQVTLELTPRRPVNGPITPQHHVTLDRPDMPLEDALALVRGLAGLGDTLLMLGGLGDALLHPHWQAIVQAAHDAGVWGIGLETDLHVDPPTLQALLDAPLDLLVVRVNADTSSTYHQVMLGQGAPAPSPDAPDPFKRCVENLQWLLNTRNARWQQPDAPPHARAGLPWVVPSLIKTRQTLRDMETFFDRWMVYAGHAVIAPPQTGCGLMPDQALVPMAPPRRRPCRQVGRRVTILSDGQVAQCDQDWLGQAALGRAMDQPLDKLAHRLQVVRALHEAQRWDESPLCAACDQWHRP